MKLKGVLGASLVLATVLASACGREDSAPKPEPTPAAVRTTRQEARSDYNKVLILGSSVNGGLDSPEAQAVLGYRPDAQITVVTPEQWELMSANEFSQYHLIIIGDPGCVTGTAPFQAAIENRDVWGPVVDSEVVIVGASTNGGGSQPLLQAGIHQALDNGVQLYTSMYISLGCAYQNAPPNTPVEVLEPFGTFKVQGLSTCADSGHRFVTFPSQLFSDQLFDMALPGADGCATRTVFTEYPVRNLTATVLATDISGSNPIPGGKSYQDYDEGLIYEGTPYVFVRNVSAVGAGCGGDSMNVPEGEECDLGDGFNGQRGDICSFSCRLDWCGNGVLDAGEECDNGFDNQRTPQGDIINGNCSAFCKVIDVPNTNPPPVALCRNVTETVTNQCGMNADINNGSYDPGGEPVTCTQTAAGPYNIGNTTVTLTCEDASGQQASCTGVVTIKDGVKPVVTIAGLNPQPVECNRNGVYTNGFEPNPAATANDMCSGTVPVSKSGTVNMAAIGTYQRIYTATDSAGNVGTATRTVNVADTLKPVVTTPTTVAPLECKMSTYTDVPPTANDQCAGTVSVTTAGAVNVNVVGNYPLTYTARDPAGNVSDPKVRNVVVRDSRAPSVTLNGPTNVAVECNDPGFADPGATGSDVCAGTVPATPIQAVSPGTPGTYTVSYQAADPSGNIGVSGSSRVFVVSDTLPPVLTMNGAANMPLECANTFTDPGATANDQCAGNLTVTKTGSVNERVLGPQTLTYSANDGRGHTASATRTVTVSDTQAPAITITGSLTPPPVECGGGYTDPGATANDACAGALPTVAEPPANPNQPGNYNVRYRATDPSGNTTLSTASRAVTVQDTLAPVLTLNGSATMGLECATAYTEQGATANDQCAGNLNVTISGTVDNHQLTTQTVTYSANDGNGHTATKTRAVTVSDTLAPAITLNGPLNLPVECGDPAYADPGASANDACAGALPAVPEPPANPNVPGNYVVRYRATDPSGNSALSSTGRTVTVSDTLPPTLQLAGANPQQVECGTAWADPGSTASDQCAGVLTPTASGGVNHLVPADYPITYTVSDGQGHTVTANRAVNVRDTLPPSITVNGPANDSFACGNTYTDPGATANDACDTNVEVIATQTGNASQPGSFTITYKARDDAGHEVTSPVTRTVTVTDDAPPTLVLQGNASPVLECPTPFSDEGATANDACYGDVTNRIQVAGSVTAGSPGTYPLTYTVTDPSGQSAPAVTRTVTVQDTQRPQVTVNGPLDIPVECGSGTFTDPGASASDACAGVLAAVPSTTANPGAPGTYTISYTATDPSGNVGTSNTNRTVRVIDSLAPQISLTGGNMALECASPWNDPGATASDQCAGSLAVTASGSVNNRQVGVPQTITYTANDGTNQATVSRTVTVNDTLPPTLALNGPANDTFACGDNYMDPGATATDACDPNVTVIATQTGNPGQPGTFTITYSARDASNNVVASPVTRTVTVGDDGPPTLALLGSPTPSLECGTAFNDPGATANDACFGDVTDRIQVAGTVNSGTPGSYPLTYTVTDPSGQSATPATRTVSVQDTLAPSITVLGSLNQELQCDHAPYADPGATATDACAGNLTGSIQRVGGVNTGAAGSYTLTYRVTDPSDNTATSGDVRTVTVVDNLPPTITLEGGTPAAHECGSPFADPGATANDACAGDLTANINVSGTVNPNAIGQYPLNYTVMDPSGLTANTQRVVNVNDTLAPTLTLNGLDREIIECGSDYEDLGATANDVCAGNLDAQIQRVGAANSRVVGTYQVTYSVSDPAGHAATPVTRTVEVRDTASPGLTLLGEAAMTVECRSIYWEPGATAEDACAGDLSDQVVSSGTIDTDKIGTYTIHYTVTDGNELSANATRTVEVKDTLPPTIICPQAIVVHVLEGTEAEVSLGTATATDTCDLDAVRITGPSETRFPVGSTPVTYTATDATGNTASCTSTVTVVSDSLPDTFIVVGPPEETQDVDALFEFSASKPDVTYECSLDGADFRGCSVSETFTGLAEGSHTLQVRARDSAGNVDPTPASATWTVVPVPVEDLDRALLGGAGCSSASGGSSTLGWIGIGALAALFARRRRQSRLPVLAVLLLGSRAFAQLDGVPSFELELLRLNPSATGSLVLGTGELLQNGDYRLSLTTHYENDPLVLFHNGVEVGVLVQHRATAHLAASYGAWEWLELGAQVPVLLLQRGEDLSAYGRGQPEKGPALGTPLLTLRVKLLAQREEMPVDLALGVHVGPAVGSGMALAREPRALPSLMVGRQFRRLRAALDAGILLRPRTVLSPDNHIQDELGHALRLGGTVSTLGSGLRGELALTGSVPLYREGAFIEALAGARLPVGASVEAYAMAGVAAGTAPGTPDFRLLLGVAYGRTQPPRAETRIPEPVAPPPPPDGEGVEEAVDPVKDSDIDAPPPPPDGEAVEEAVDPVKDSDSDGILDEEDACPLVPGIPEMHGCPAQDTDQDTVLDHVDNCPEAAGPPANQGCPEEEKQLVVIQRDRIEIRETVHFNFDKATIQPRSFPLLNQVARILVEHPEILSVSIEGHTDSQGSAAYNRDLSRRRAESVRNYLAQKGVARERMEARGFGEDRPVQTNATDAGRAANRRVDFMTRYTPSAP